MEPSTLLTSITLFDGTGASAQRDSALLFRGDRVIAAGPIDAVEAQAAGAKRVDLDGAFVMPGLIDSHVHLHFPIRGHGDWPLGFVEYPEFSVLKAAFNAQVYLATGVTTVMDQGTRGNLAVALREAVESGVSLGPRIVASGMVLSPTAGLADEHAPFVHSDHPFGQVADTPDEWRRAIRLQAKDGVDNIKIGVSGSALVRFSDGNATDMSRTDIELVVAEAHRYGMTVAAHCHPAGAFRDTIRAGVDTIHHGFAMDESCIEALIEEPNVFFVPTAGKLTAMIEGGRARGRSQEVLKRYEALRHRFHEMLGACVTAGLANRIALGSDQGHLPVHGHTADELAVFVEAGMSPGEALQSATRVASEAVGLSDLVGTLEPGKLADILIVDGDPLADVTVLSDRENLTTVIQGGRTVAERGTLTANLDLTRPLSLEPVSGRRSRIRPRR